jgi:hypothetical protein
VIEVRRNLLVWIAVVLASLVVGCGEEQQKIERRDAPIFCEELKEVEPNSPVRGHICNPEKEWTRPKTVSL